MYMKKALLMIAGLAFVLSSCEKKPEDVVAEIYDSANNFNVEKIIPYILPDSVAPLSEAEIEVFKSNVIREEGVAPMYSVLDIDTLRYNAALDSASFTAHTTFKNGVSYIEQGKIYKNAEGKWMLSLDENDYTTSNDKEYTPELMRNLRYALDMVLASRGIPYYQKVAATYYFDGVMSYKDLKNYFNLIKSAADKGDVEAIRLLAMAYKEGYGTEKNPQKAFELFNAAAEKGDAESIFKVSKCFIDGVGTPVDYDEAFKWAKKAADTGNSDGLRNLGYLYECGLGVEKDHEKAFEYFKKAADAGNEYGHFNMATLYENGRGVEKDLDKALEHYKKAMDMNGNLANDSAVRIGDIYYYDKKDYDKAFYYYKKAADAKYPDGLYHLGLCFEYGRGTAQNRQKAANLYRQARDNGHNEATNALMRVW